MMERKIKYKFYDKKLKKICDRQPQTYDFFHQDIVPIQYLDIFDKKGKEFYDGCIVKTMKNNPLIVTWKDGCYGCETNDDFIPICMLPYNTFEIIDDIYHRSNR